MQQQNDKQGDGTSREPVEGTITDSLSLVDAVSIDRNNSNIRSVRRGMEVDSQYSRYVEEQRREVPIASRGFIEPEISNTDLF
jgi:hypothetical protein